MRTMSRISKKRRVVLPLLAIGLFSAGVERGFAADGATGRVAEHVTLTNGFDLICDHREQSGDRVRLYTERGQFQFCRGWGSRCRICGDHSAASIAFQHSATAKPTSATHADLTKAELHELLSSAGAQHNLDVNLLASVVRAESGGHTAAVSKKGAQGLMQLMPKTASQLGVATA